MFKPYFTLIIFCFIIFISCYNNDKKTVVSSSSFPLMNLDTNEYKENCHKIRINYVEFHITHKDKSINLNNYGIIIRINRNIVYNGRYKSAIIINKFPFCDEDNLSRISTIEINAIDYKNKIVYLWSNKDSYYLLNYRKIFIQLNCNENENYKIKFDNQLIWR